MRYTRAGRDAKRRRLVALIAVVAVVSGCGEERLSKPAYEQRVRATYAVVQRAFRATDVDSTVLLSERVAAAQASLRRAADRLDVTAPPTEVEKANDELVAGLRAYASDLDRLKLALARGDLKAIARFNSGIGANRAIAQITKAAEEMQEKRYDLGGIAKE